MSSQKSPQTIQNFVKPLTPLTAINTQNSTPPKTSQPSKSPKTMQSYLQRAQQLLNYASARLNTPELILPDAISFLVDFCATKSPSTVRLYRASLQYYLEFQFQQGVISESEFNIMSAALRSIKHGIKSQQNLTSTKKAKCASTKTIQKLLKKLNKSSSRYAKITSLLFMGSLIAGLRPVEWKDAKLIKTPEGGILIVQNAKNTNGRSFGDIRELYIPHAHVAIIEQTITAVTEALKTMTWDKLYENCRKIMHRAGIKNKGKNVTLYTARHQFIANMKNLYSKEEVALLAGHRSPETATTHYGKRRSGHPEFKNNVRLVSAYRQENT